MLRSKVTICVLVFLFMVIFSKTVSALFLRALSSPPRLALRLIRQKMKPTKLRRRRKHIGK